MDPLCPDSQLPDAVPTVAISASPDSPLIPYALFISPGLLLDPSLPAQSLDSAPSTSTTPIHSTADHPESGESSSLSPHTPYTPGTPSSSVATPFEASGTLMPPPLSPSSPGLFTRVLSPQQMLAVIPDLQPYTPMGAFLNRPAPPISQRVAHTSSKKNGNYQPILRGLLIKTPPLIINRFRTVVKSMSPSVSFATPVKLPFDASAMSSEGDVSSYLDSQVVISAWQVVVRMIPPERRSYDLLSVKQFYTQEGIPDQVFGVSRVREAGGRKVFQSCAILEFKAPGIVRGMLTVIQNMLADKKVDLTDDWITVTRLLRKYAVSTGTRDAVVMDETTAIYFRFPPNPNEESEIHEYLVASLVEIPTVPSDLLLREIIAFLCWRSFLEKGVKMRDFNNSSAQATRATVDEDGSVGQTPPSSMSTKRPPDSSGSRAQPKRGKRDGRPEEALFNGWTLNSSVTMEMLPQFAGRARSQSPDSGFHESSPCPTEYQRPRTFHPSQLCTDGGRQTLVFNIERTITRNVGVLTSSIGPQNYLLLAKLFPLHPDSPTLLARELDVYNACHSLQGNEIPHFYGVWHITHPPAFSSIVLLTEFISPGTTISELRSAALEMTDPLELERARARLSALQETGTRGIEGLHRHGVMHNDPVGRNLVVCADEPSGLERVVIVDFDMAQVHEDQDTVDYRAWQDWTFFRNAFKV